MSDSTKMNAAVRRLVRENKVSRKEALKMLSEPDPYADLREVYRSETHRGRHSFRRIIK